MNWLKKLDFFFRNDSLCSRKFSGATVHCAKIDKILIANRGEIACRIIKTTKKLGIKTVAIYSDADKNSLHVECADEAYYIGSAPSAESYLKQDAIITTAQKAQCQAIHPGYGFLSENTEFAESCQKQNIIFIGPSAKAIREMGIKSTSKNIMIKAGVPVIRGYHGYDQSDSTLVKEATNLGFPLLIKAVRGGGGKGMRIAWREEEFFQALESARTESLKAFGDSSILLEQYITRPRHIEVQIFADTYGNVVHLFERDCSIQRRHQKVIEEAPADHKYSYFKQWYFNTCDVRVKRPGITQKLREELGATAVRAAKAVNYVGAGTIEFIMDQHTHSFHFMEMNTRLQVEHPITEMITGVDLVEWQLKIASGEELPLKQKDIKLKGHSFESRIYSENPNDRFLPGAGKLEYLTLPLESENVRVETGVRQNDEVSVYYDPLIAKLVIWGKDRKEALNIMKCKLSECNIIGVDTNVEFIKDIFKHPRFQNAAVHTGFIEEHCTSLFSEIPVPVQIIAKGSLGLILCEKLDLIRSSTRADSLFHPFTIKTGFRLNHTLCRRIHFFVGSKKFFVDVKYVKKDSYAMKINNSGPWRKVTGLLKKKEFVLELQSDIDGVIEKTRLIKIKNDLHMFTHTPASATKSPTLTGRNEQHTVVYYAGKYSLNYHTSRICKDRKWSLLMPHTEFCDYVSNQTYIESTATISPMSGIVDKILVKKGDNVTAGDQLLVVIAMKMEYSITATSNGVVEDILCDVGDYVPKSKLLIKFRNNEDTYR